MWIWAVGDSHIQSPAEMYRHNIHHQCGENTTIKEQQPPLALNETVFIK